MGRRALVRWCATLAVTLLSTVLGTVLLSGTGQPVTAHPYPRWQEVASPPFSARTHPLLVQVGHRVEVLGGLAADGSRLRDGAAYDVRTGRWSRLVAPVAVTDRDPAVSAAGVLVVDAGRSWWRYDPRSTTWSHLGGLPHDVRSPSGFRSEIYALSGRRVVVYSPELGRWTRLAADRRSPGLRPRSVLASRTGTIVTGVVQGRLVSDRWDGLRWRRQRATTEARRVHARGIRLVGDRRVFLLRGDHAWIRLP
jgi:hypothetical protein